MRILVLGAGGIGGYFGARIHNAGGDVTFLVRPARAENLRTNGLRVSSAFGDTHIVPKLVTTAENLSTHFDVIILSCKAYDLKSALESISPVMGTDSIVLPLLNGVAHLDALDARFGRERVLGGAAHLAVSLSPTGEIKHLNKVHRLIVGSRCTQPSKWHSPLAELLSATCVEFSVSDHVEQDMWDKFVFFSTLAGVTCTMRANIGEILSTCAGETFIIGMLDECGKVAAVCRHPSNSDQLAAYRSLLTERGSSLTASMLRDIERGGSTEADHVIGDMVRRGNVSGVDIPLLKLAYSHLQAYELARERPRLNNA